MIHSLHQLPTLTSPLMHMLAALLCTLLAAGASAQERATRSALIVGVGAYESPDVPPLAGVPFDIVSARQIAQSMGIPSGRITVLRDAAATKQRIVAELEQLSASTSEGARVFIYFSGHGTRWYEPSLSGCKEGLLSYDRQTLTNEEIARHTRKMSAVADKVIVMFDACHSEGVNTARGTSRSMGGLPLTPKFYQKGGEQTAACAKATNLPTRGLLSEATRLGALSENFVQITSSLPDEVSFDEPGKGGIATQAVRDCLLGRARDRDGSGAVSLQEITHCAQQVVNEKIKPFSDLRPHHITVSGNRNIVPVAVQRPVAVAAPAAAPAVPAALPALPVAAPPVAPTLAATSPPAPASPPAALPPPSVPPAAPAPAPAPAPTLPSSPPADVPPPALASLATLQEIAAQQNPRRKLEVSLRKSTLRIGQDMLSLTVKSSHDGYAYLVMLGSDRQSFYVLFPNGLDEENRVRASQPLTLPRADWQLRARGPAGTNQLLVLVADTPRDLKALTLSPPDAKAPFTFALNDLPGRSALIDFLAGRGVTGGSESFSARIVPIREQ